MLYKEYESKYLQNVANLIQNTYKAFNMKEGNSFSTNKYYNFFSYKNNYKLLEKKFQKSTIFYMAVHKKKVIGIIRGTKNRISNLYVEKNYQNKGVATNLLNLFENKAKEKINVRASLFATSFYIKKGYKKTTGIRKYKGLLFQPFKKIL